MTPACVDDASANAAAMNTTTDPNSSGSASLPTTLTGEIQRLRHVLKHVTGWTQWWTHYEDLNFGNRTARVHLTTTTGYKEMFRGEMHLGSSTTRYHLLSISAQTFNIGEAHPESMMILAHVNTTLRFGVTIGGDVHVGSTLALHAYGLRGFPVIYQTANPTTGIYFPAANHVGISASGLHVAVFHSAGLMAPANASVDIGTVSGSRFRHLHLTGALVIGTGMTTSASFGDIVLANTTGQLRFVNGAGTDTVAGVSLDSSNVVDIGIDSPAADALRIRVNSSSSQLVTTQGVDTCGAGFRCLRVPN